MNVNPFEEGCCILMTCWMLANTTTNYIPTIQSVHIGKVGKMPI